MLRLVLVVVVVLVAGAATALWYLQTEDGDTKPTADERRTCEALRDVMTAVETRSPHAEWKRTIEALTPAANRTDNEVLIANATQARRVWNEWDRSRATTGPAELFQPLFAMQGECERLGVAVSLPGGTG